MYFINIISVQEDRGCEIKEYFVLKEFSVPCVRNKWKNGDREMNLVRHKLIFFLLQQLNEIVLNGDLRMD